MQHELCMPKGGLIMQPDGHWDGGKAFQFQIDGISDSSNANRTKLTQMVWRSTSVFIQGSNSSQKENARKCVHSPWLKESWLLL